MGVDFYERGTPVNKYWLSDLLDNLEVFEHLLDYYNTESPVLNGDNHKNNSESEKQEPIGNKQVLKALDVELVYMNKNSVFTLYTPHLTHSLSELVNQSILHSSGLGVRIHMGSEYLVEDLEGKVMGTVSNVRDELRRCVMELSGDNNMLNLLEDGIRLAQDWFGN